MVLQQIVGVQSTLNIYDVHKPLLCNVSEQKPLSKPDVHTLLLERGWAGGKREQSCQTLVIWNTLRGCIPQPQRPGKYKISIFLLNYNIYFSRTLGIDGQKLVALSSKDSTNLLYHNWSRNSISNHQIRWEWRGENFNQMFYEVEINNWARNFISGILRGWKICRKKKLIKYCPKGKLITQSSLIKVQSSSRCAWLPLLFTSYSQLLALRGYLHWGLYQQEAAFVGCSAPLCW